MKRPATNANRWADTLPRKDYMSQKVSVTVVCACGVELLRQTDARYSPSNQLVIVVNPHECAAQHSVQSDVVTRCANCGAIMLDCGTLCFECANIA